MDDDDDDVGNAGDGTHKTRPTTLHAFVREKRNVATKTEEERTNKMFHVKLK